MALKIKRKDGGKESRLHRSKKSGKPAQTLRGKNGNSDKSPRGIVTKDRSTVSKEGRESKGEGKSKKLNGLLGGLKKNFHSEDKPDKAAEDRRQLKTEPTAVKKNGSGSSAGESASIRFNQSPQSKGDDKSDDVFNVGAEVTPPPEVDGEPEQTVDDPIGHKEIYRDGDREVTQTLRPDGSVVTTYEDENGVPHTETKKEDGTSVIEIGGEAPQGEDLNTREVHYDADGNVISEHVDRSEFHPNGAQKRHEVHNVEYGEGGKPISENESTDTFDDAGSRLTTRSSETEHHQDGSKTISERVKEADGTGFIGTKRLDAQGKVAGNDRLNIGKDGVNPADFTRKLNQLAESGDPRRAEDLLRFLGEEELARVSAGASLSGEEGFRSFLDAASEAANLSRDTAGRLAEGLLDGIATDKYSFSDPPRENFQIGRDTEGLAVHFQDIIAEGGSSNLGVTFATQLSENLKTERAAFEKGDFQGDPIARQEYLRHLGGGFEDVADGLTNGFESQFENFDALAAPADEQNARLQQLSQAYGPFLNDDQLAEATTEFYKAHPEFQRVDDAADPLVGNLNDLFRLQDVLSDPAHEESGAVSVSRGEAEGLVGEVPDKIIRASGTEKGASELAETLLREADAPDSTFLGRLTDIPGSDDRKQRLNAAIERVGVGAATDAELNQDPELAARYLDGTAAASPDFAQAVGILKSATSSSLDIDEFKTSLRNATNGLSPEARARIGLAGTTLGLAGLVASGVDVAGGDRGAEDLLAFGSEATDVGSDVLKLAYGETFALKAAGKVASGVGVVLSAVEAARALGDGEYVSAALNTASVVGGVLTLAGVPVVGPAIAVVAGAASIGYGQYRKSQASNYFEGNGPGAEDARRFIDHALDGTGLSGEDREAVVNKLKDADDDGSLAGLEIQEVAENFHFEPGALLTEIAKLGPDAVGDIVNAAHSVGGSNPTLLQDLGAQDINRSFEIGDLAAYLQEEFGISLYHGSPAL